MAISERIGSRRTSQETSFSGRSQRRSREYFNPDLEVEQITPQVPANEEISDTLSQSEEPTLEDLKNTEAFLKGIEGKGGISSQELHRKEVGQTKLLTASEEVELAMLIEKGKKAEEKKVATKATNGLINPEWQNDINAGRQARDRMCEANMRLVARMSLKFLGRGLDQEDIEAYGYFGLLRAIDGFDYRRGFKFSTYATWWIRQSMMRAVADFGRGVRLPVHMIETVSKLEKIRRRLQNDLQREPTFAEIGQGAGIPAEKVEMCFFHAQATASLEANVHGDNGEESDTPLSEMIASQEQSVPDTVNYKLLKQQIADILSDRNAFDEREKRVIELRYGLEDGRCRTLEEVGQEFGVTRERIRQIEAKAIRKLRHPTRTQKLEDYLE